MFLFRRRKPSGRSPDEALHAVADRLRDPALTAQGRGVLRMIAAFCMLMIAPNPISRWRAAMTRARS